MFPVAADERALPVTVKFHSRELSSSLRDFRPQLAHVLRNLFPHLDSSTIADFTSRFATTGGQRGEILASLSFLCYLSLIGFLTLEFAEFGIQPRNLRIILSPALGDLC